MPKEVKYHNFNGKRYKIEHVPPSVLQYDNGKCSNPATKGKKIQINNTLDDKELLRAYLHESLHALEFSWDEITVINRSNDLTNFLWRLGYRKSDGNI